LHSELAFEVKEREVLWRELEKAEIYYEAVWMTQSWVGKVNTKEATRCLTSESAEFGTILHQLQEASHHV